MSFPRSGFHLYERIIGEYLYESGMASGHLRQVAPSPDEINSLFDSPSTLHSSTAFYVNFHLEPYLARVDEVLRLLASSKCRFGFTKSHDVDGQFPERVDLPVLVLIRDPFHQALSDFWAQVVTRRVTDDQALGLQIGDHEWPSSDEFLAFLVRRLPYYGAFYGKWIAAEMPGRQVMPYEQTVLSPLDSASEVLLWLFPELTIDRKCLARVCDQVAGELNLGPGRSVLSQADQDGGVHLSKRSRLMSLRYRSVLGECRDDLASCLGISNPSSAEGGIDLGRSYFHGLMALAEDEFCVRLGD